MRECDRRRRGHARYFAPPFIAALSFSLIGTFLATWHLAFTLPELGAFVIAFTLTCAGVSAAKRLEILQLTHLLRDMLKGKKTDQR